MYLASTNWIRFLTPVVNHVLCSNHQHQSITHFLKFWVETVVLVVGIVHVLVSPT